MSTENETYTPPTAVPGVNPETQDLIDRWVAKTEELQRGQFAFMFARADEQVPNLITRERIG